MKYREIGKTGVTVSEISFGCWTTSGLTWKDGWPIGWAEVNEDEVTGAIKLGLDAGVNHFDNADSYGLGKAERMLARCLKRLGVKTTDVIIGTKIGHFPGTAEFAYEPAHIRHQCEQSLINLGRDYLDIYYFHHGDFGPDNRFLESAAATMDALVKEGKVRLKGQSAYSAKDFLNAVPVVRPHVLQSEAHALKDEFIRAGSPVAKLMDENELSLVAFSPLAQGILLDKFDPANPPKFEDGDFRSRSERFNAENLAKIKPGLEKLKARFGSSVQDLAAVALNYVLSFPNVCCVIPGFRNEKQATCNLAAAGRELTRDDVEFVRAAMQG